MLCQVFMYYKKLAAFSHILNIECWNEKIDQHGEHIIELLLPHSPAGVEKMYIMFMGL